jgi:hypothetical protein
MLHAEPISPAAAYGEALRFTILFQQIPVGFLFALDSHGGLALIFGCAAAGFWIGVGWLLARRASRPSRTDMLFIRWGFFPLLVAPVVLAVVWSRWWAP